MREVLTAFLLLCASAYAQDTTRPGLQRPRQETEPATYMLRADSLKITATGYSKPQGSNVETLFLTNADTCTVSGCFISLTYTTADGRMLHRRSVCLPDRIPAGETRLVTFRSWDPQHDFYYYRNETPRQDNKMPYRVAFSIDSARVEAPSANKR